MVVDVVDEPLVLRGRGQFAVAQQPRDLKEVGTFAQLFDRIAAVPQDRMLAVDVGDLRLALRGRQESWIERHPIVVAQRRHDDAVRPRARLHDRQFELIGFHMQLRYAHAASCMLVIPSDRSLGGTGYGPHAVRLRTLPTTIGYSRFEAPPRLKSACSTSPPPSRRHGRHNHVPGPHGCADRPHGLDGISPGTQPRSDRLRVA